MTDLSFSNSDWGAPSWERLQVRKTSHLQECPADICQLSGALYRLRVNVKTPILHQLGEFRCPVWVLKFWPNPCRWTTSAPGPTPLSTPASFSPAASCPASSSSCWRWSGRWWWAFSVTPPTSRPSSTLSSTPSSLPPSSSVWERPHSGQLNAPTSLRYSITIPMWWALQVREEVRFR